MKKIIASLLFLASLSPLTVMASNDWFMDNTAAGNFTPDDTQMFTTAVKKALDNNGNGKKLKWKNAKTGATGYILPLNTTRTSGAKCRELQIFNEAKGVTGESKFKFCKIQGEWKIVQ